MQASSFIFYLDPLSLIRNLLTLFCYSLQNNVLTQNGYNRTNTAVLVFDTYAKLIKTFCVSCKIKKLQKLDQKISNNLSSLGLQ